MNFSLICDIVIITVIKNDTIILYSKTIKMIFKNLYSQYKNSAIENGKVAKRINIKNFN